MEPLDGEKFLAKDHKLTHIKEFSFFNESECNENVYDLDSKIENYIEENLVGEFGREQESRIREIIKDFVTYYL